MARSDVTGRQRDSGGSQWMPPPPTRGRQHRGDGCNRTPNTVAQAMSHVPPSPSGTIFSVFYAIPTVSLDVISWVASSCGHYRGHIEQRAAHECAVHVAT